jgi:hypothetical protein
MADTPTTPTETLSPAVAAFTARWAEFSKSFAIYPLSNTRVQKALDDLLECLVPAFEEAEIDEEIGLQILFAREQVRAGRQVIPLNKHSPLGWLEERVRRTALAGIAFLPDVTGDSIAAFTERLLEHYKRKELDRPFDELWPETYEGLLLIDRRFEGYFDDAATGESTGAVSWGEDSDGPGHGKANKEVARLLAEDDKIVKQLDQLKVQVQGHETSDEGGAWRRIDILPRIVQLLPRDALQHYDQAVLVTVQVMENLAERLARTERGGNLGAFADDTALNQLIYATSRGIFGRRAPSTAEIAKRLDKERQFRRKAEKGKLRSGRASDAAVEDSFDLLQQDMERLPEPFADEMESHNSESHDEQLGVYLHVLLRIDTESQTEGMKKQIADLLEGASDRRLHTLKEYLESTAESGHPGYRRLIDLMCDRSLQGVLRTSGFLETAKILAEFPRYFGLYLEAIDPDSNDDLRELESVCSELGSQRVRDARRALVEQEGIVEKHRAETLLGRPSLAMLPFVRILLAEGDDAQRVGVVRMMKRLRINVREACLLYIWDDPVGLPIEYLLTIADPDRSREDLEALHPKISHQICRYLAGTTAGGGDDQHRIYAIHHLGMFGGRESEFVLRKLITAKRFRLFPVESKAVRDAAASALETLQRRPLSDV